MISVTFHREPPALMWACCQVVPSSKDTSTVSCRTRECGHDDQGKAWYSQVCANSC
jgi:hypothetical protein